MNGTICNNCGHQFVVDEFRLGMTKKDDLEVQYFSCPACRAKYLLFTSDSRMRNLVERRKAVQMKLRAARLNKFREKTIEKYVRELDQIKKEQEGLLPELKAAGEAILHGIETPRNCKEDAQ